MKSKITLWSVNLVLALFLSVSVSGQNSVSITSAPSSVEIGSDQNLNVSYKKPDTSKGYVQIWLKNYSGAKIGEWTNPVTNKTGSVSFSIKIPQVPKGNGYRWYAQLVNGQWKGVAAINGPSVLVEADSDTPATSSNLSFSSSPGSVTVGSSYTVKVGYSKEDNAKAYAQLWLKNPSNEKVKEWTETIAQSNGTATFKIEIPQTPKGSGYKWYAQLVDSSWKGFASLYGKSVTVGSGPEDPETPDFGVCSSTDKANGVKCYTSGQSQRALDEDMGNGYWSNWFVSSNWNGPLKANFKKGTNPWVEWNNNTSDRNKHNEFDLKIQKSAWKETGGLPAKISAIQNSINVSMKGRYSEGSKGKGHINMTAWLSKNKEWGDRVDIIVHAFDNQGQFYKKYTDGPNGRYTNMGSFKASNGLTYRVLRTRPGGYQELASYNLIPDALVQKDPDANISTATISSKIEMKEIIDKLIQIEQSFKGVRIPIDPSWHIFNLEWTVVGQSGGYNHDGSNTFTPNSKGRFTFSDYYIADVKVGGTALKSKLPPKDSLAVTEGLQKVSAFPNPFTNSFDYEYSVEKDGRVTVNLYALDGRKVKTLKNSENHQPGNYSDAVDTNDLDAGVYILRISSSEGEKTVKLIKN